MSHRIIYKEQISKISSSVLGYQSLQRSALSTDHSWAHLVFGFFFFFFCLNLFFVIELQLIHNIVLVSVVQRSDLVLYIYIQLCSYIYSYIVIYSYVQLYIVMYNYIQLYSYIQLCTIYIQLYIVIYSYITIYNYI